MAAIDAVFRGGNIVLFATPDQIARQREELQNWRDDQLSRVPRRIELAKALVAAPGDGLAKAADLLAKADPIDLVDARELLERVRVDASARLEEMRADACERLEKVRADIRERARQIINQGFIRSMLADHSFVRHMLAVEEIREMIKAHETYRERYAELDRLERRSEARRFAIAATRSHRENR